jgi:drug/metabolite transporter (DMT)-like permease
LYFSGFFSDVNLLQPQDLKSVGAISILGLFGTAISLVMFNRLIQMTNAVFASSVTYLIPVFALIWGLLDHEKTGLVQIAGLFLILIGIAVIRRSDRTKIL